MPDLEKTKEELMLENALLKQKDELTKEFAAILNDSIKDLTDTWKEYTKNIDDKLTDTIKKVAKLEVTTKSLNAKMIAIGSACGVLGTGIGTFIALQIK